MKLALLGRATGFQVTQKQAKALINLLESADCTGDESKRQCQTLTWGSWVWRWLSCWCRAVTQKIAFDHKSGNWTTKVTNRALILACQCLADVINGNVMQCPARSSYCMLSWQLLQLQDTGPTSTRLLWLGLISEVATSVTNTCSSYQQYRYESWYGVESMVQPLPTENSLMWHWVHPCLA